MATRASTRKLRDKCIIIPCTRILLDGLNIFPLDPCTNYIYLHADIRCKNITFIYKDDLNPLSLEKAITFRWRCIEKIFVHNAFRFHRITLRFNNALCDYCSCLLIVSSVEMDRFRGVLEIMKEYVMLKRHQRAAIRKAAQKKVVNNTGCSLIAKDKISADAKSSNSKSLKAAADGQFKMPSTTPPQPSTTRKM